MPGTLKGIFAMAASIVAVTVASAQSARDIRVPSPLANIENEAPPRLIMALG